jgi:hypothetical protein
LRSERCAAFTGIVIHADLKETSVDLLPHQMRPEMLEEGSAQKVREALCATRRSLTADFSHAARMADSLIDHERISYAAVASLACSSHD